MGYVKLKTAREGMRGHKNGNEIKRKDHGMLCQMEREKELRKRKEEKKNELHLETTA